MSDRDRSGYNVTRDTLLIRGHKIPIRWEEIDESRLRFYEENPRIYSIVRKKGEEPTQEEIQAQLLAMDHVKELVQDIKRHEGLIDPIIVRDGTFDVLEGNSRLAAYRALVKQDPVKWAKVSCTILPRDVDEKLVFALLAQVHVKGKKDWAPFEQAGFLYRRFHDQKVDLHALAQESSLSQQRVRQLIDTYAYMLECGEEDTTRWSHYEEFLKSRAIKKAREKHPEFEERVVSLLRSDQTLKAVDVRDSLPKIALGPDKNLKRFSEGKIDFAKALEVAIDSGNDNSIVRKINKFRQWLAEPDILTAMKAIEGDELKKTMFELGKIRARVIALESAIERRNKG